MTQPANDGSAGGKLHVPDWGWADPSPPFRPDSSVGPSGTVLWYWILSCDYLYSALHWRPKHVQVQTDPNLTTPGAVVIFSLQWSSIVSQSWIMNYKPTGFGRFDPCLFTPTVTGWKAGTHTPIARPLTHSNVGGWTHPVSCSLNSFILAFSLLKCSKKWRLKEDEAREGADTDGCDGALMKVVINGV